MVASFTESYKHWSIASATPGSRTEMYASRLGSTLSERSGTA